jgi:hypothetical protein
MKILNQNQRANQSVANFKDACVGSCQKILARIEQAKAAIFAESRKAFQAKERLLRLALNEAEAVAWQSLYPHLLFPTLATEKVQALADWDAHQRAVRRANPAAAFSA